MAASFVSLQLNDSYKPVTDGVAVCVENYARHLARRGTSTAVATPWVPGFTDSDEFPVFRYASVPIPGWKPYRAGLPDVDPGFRRHLRSWMDTDAATPVVLHAHSPFSSAALARRIRRRLRGQGRSVVLVATLHSKYHSDFARVLPEPIVEQILRVIRRSFEAADLVWVPNRGTERTLRWYGYEGPVTIVPNGADLEPPEDGRYAELRGRGATLLNLDDSDRILLFVGQHRWEKNIELILRGFDRYRRSRAAEDFRGWSRLVLVGDGPDRRAIAALADDLGLLDADGRSAPLTLYGHVSDRREMEALYARADLFVFPSIYDNAPLVVREAAAFRTPSILAAGSDAAGDTADRRNAFHVDPEVPALASLLEDLGRSPQLLTAVAQAARREVFRSWDDIVVDVRRRYAQATAY